MIICPDKGKSTGWVCTRETTRIRVQTINIYGAANIFIIYTPGFGSHSLLVTRKGDNNTSISECSLDLFHVYHRGARRGVGRLLQLVLDLVEDDGPALGDGVGGDDGANLLHPGQPGIVIGRIAGPDLAEAAVRAPEGQPARGGLGVAVRAGTGDDPEAGLLCVVEEGLQVLARGLKVVDPLGGGMVGPEEVDTDGVEAVGLELLKDI